ncbi:MAG TPA: putative porin [Chitinophagaceae bacterium]|nr:putative porin [Chitinophagaceae bacterium]
MALKSFILFIILFFAIGIQSILAQNPLMGRIPRGGGGGMRSGGDSIQFEKRNFADDSATVRFRYLDTARFRSLDSTIADYFEKVPLDAEHITLGNNGTATRSLLFMPNLKAGFDAGFHAFDPYAFQFSDTRFMTTNKPFTRLTYLLGSRAEQHIGIMHTQNITPDWNAGFEYRLINAPGFYNSQNTNHKSFRINSNYTSKDRRYNAFVIYISNSLQSSENGGIESDTFLLNKNTAYNDLYNIPTNLARVPTVSRNFFNVALATGNKYTGAGFLLRQQYDFGKKDSTVMDSTVLRFFLPRLRVEHTIRYDGMKYRFYDVQGIEDTAFYQVNYGIKTIPDTVQYLDKYKELYNDFSIIQFPDASNPLQFLKVGASISNYTAIIGDNRDNFFDTKLHGEYRNRTKNRRWDMLLYGEFYVAGRNAGNYDFQASLKSFLGRKWGYLEIGGRNVNRSPSYVYRYQTSFPMAFDAGLNDENTFHLFGNVNNPLLRLKLSADLMLISNYVYLTEFYKVNQASSIFNMLRLGLNKEFRLKKNWKWYLDIYLQTLTGNAPVNVPLVYARNRFAYEGSVFRNLKLSTGFDIRYHSNYKTANYSPLLGQFFYQEQYQVSTRPDIAAYVNFRIRNFTGFTRLENLNSLTFINGFGFKNNNVETPLYPYPGLLMRLGVIWDMVN